MGFSFTALPRPLDRDLDRFTIRGGLVAFCPSCRRLLSVDETRRMTLPPGREVCTWCGQFVNKNIDSNYFG
jgi:hypothetical protein